MQFLIKLAALRFLLILLLNQFDLSKASWENETFIKETLMKEGAMSIYFLPGTNAISWTKMLPPLAGIVASVVADVTIHDIREKFAQSTYISSYNFQESMYDLEAFLKDKTDRNTAEIKKTVYEQQVDIFRQRLDYLTRCLDGDCEKCLREGTCAPEIKDYVINTLTTPSSTYRSTLSQLIPTFIEVNPSPLNSVYDSKGIFGIFVQNYNTRFTFHENCNNTKSPHMQAYDVSRYIMSSVSAAYSYIVLAYFYKLSNEVRKDFNEAKKLVTTMSELLKRFQADLDNIESRAKSAITSTSDEIRPCDPYKHIRGETYECLTKFIQGQLFSHNEQLILKFPPYITEETIANKPRIYQNSLFAINGSQKEINAWYYDPSDKERTYKYLVHKTKSLGEPVYEKKLYGKRNGSSAIEEVWFEPIETLYAGFVDHKFSNLSVRRVSLEKKEAAFGHVITGVQLAIRNKVLCIDIQEGELLGDDEIKEGTLRWNRDCGNIRSTVMLDINTRSVHLDDLRTSSGKFLTGIAFKMHEGAIYLSIKENDIIDIESPNSGYWLNDLPNYSNYSLEKEELFLDKPDASHYAPAGIQHKVSSTPGLHFVKFQPTDFEKDASQTTVPYIDIQPVITFPPTIIGGVGLYYKSQSGYGGFIGMKIMSEDSLRKLQKSKITSLTKYAEEIKKIIENSPNVVEDLVELSNKSVVPKL